MIKILHIGQLIGGLDVYIRNTINYTNNNFEFVIVRGKGDNSKPITKNNQEIKEYQIDLYRRVHPISDLKSVIQVLRIVRKEKPALIHCHSSKGGIIGRIVGYITNTKTLYTPHAFSFLSTMNWFNKSIYILMERYLKLNSYLLACSESEKQLGIKIAGYKVEKALLWSNAVPDVIIDKNDNLAVNSEKFMCYIGRPSYQKNTFFLIDVIKEVIKIVPDFKIYLLGVGHHSPDLKRLKDLIYNNKLVNNIKLIPWLSQVEALAYVKNACSYLSVSRYEGLPLSVLEAMSLGKPLIVSQVPGNIDCVENGVNGYVLPLQTSLFVSKIVEFWNSGDKRDTFGRKSKERFLKDFHIINQIKYLEEVYVNLTGSFIYKN